MAQLLRDKGRLRTADPFTEGELLERRLLGAMTSSRNKDIKRVAAAAADAFLKIYLPAG